MQRSVEQQIKDQTASFLSLIASIQPMELSNTQKHVHFSLEKPIEVPIVVVAQPSKKRGREER